MASLSLNENRSFWPRGKLLGGSSAMNALLYVRGNQRDFDVYWQSAGDSNWSWKSVLPYFKKSEKNGSPNIDQLYHGTDGLLSVDAYPNTESDENIKKILENMYSELKLGKINDINGYSYIGFGRGQGNLREGARHSSAKAYLNSSVIGERTNLHIVKYAHVKKLHIDEGTKQVVGVEFLRTIEQKTIIAKTRKEVILCAGTVNTPQILMLSGIGPEEQLKMYKIPIVQHMNGVGANLQDHIIVPLVLSFDKTFSSAPTLRNIAEDFLQYVWNQNGSFSNLGSIDYMGFINTKNDGPFPDIQILNFWLLKQSTGTVQMLLNLFNYKTDVIDSILTANHKSDTLLIFATLLNPESHGTIELNSNNPFDSPKISPNYLHHIEDVNTLVRAMKILKNLTSTKTFQKHEGKIVHIKLDECDQLPNDSDVYWECYVRHLTLTLYHPAGTAKMGKKNDGSNVVDANLNVFGINGLRVADASM